MRAQTLAAAESFAQQITLTQLPERMAALVEAADALNGYFADSAPWDLMKEEATQERAGTVVYVALDSLRMLFEAMHQVIPVSAEKALSMMGRPVPSAPWQPALDGLEGGGALGEIEVLFARVD